jgi:hypothetical protein
VKDIIAIVAIIAGLVLVAGCRSKDSPAPTTAAQEDRKPPASAGASTKNPQTADRGQATSDRPHEKDSDLLQAMK